MLRPLKVKRNCCHHLMSARNWELRWQRCHECLSLLTQTMTRRKNVRPPCTTWHAKLREPARDCSWRLEVKERYRNTKHPFDTRTEKMRQNSPNMFGTYKTQRNRFLNKWKILKKCKPYSNTSKKCSLCWNEKFIIICKKELCSLNRRNELASSCLHRNRYVLRNFRVT